MWADYAARYAAGMTQQAIADALGVTIMQVSRRIRWNGLNNKIKSTISDGILDEGHLEAISLVSSDVANLKSWLSTETAQRGLSLAYASTGKYFPHWPSGVWGGRGTGVGNISLPARATALTLSPPPSTIRSFASASSIGSASSATAAHYLATKRATVPSASRPTPASAQPAAARRSSMAGVSSVS